MATTSSTPARGFAHFNSLIFAANTPSVVNAAANVTYTPAQVLGGLILRDPNGGARTDNLPSAAALVAALPGFAVGSCINLQIRNDGAATITVAAGPASTLSGTATIATTQVKAFRIRFTNVTLGSEAYVAYSLGSLTF